MRSLDISNNGKWATETHCSTQVFTFELYFVLSEPIQGYESIWFIGDEFLTKAVGYLNVENKMTNCSLRRILIPKRTTPAILT